MGTAFLLETCRVCEQALVEIDERLKLSPALPSYQKDVRTIENLEVRSSFP